MHRLLLAALVVAVVVLAWWHFGGPAAAPSPPPPSPEDSFTAQAPAAVWDAGAAGSYTCPDTLADGWCVLPLADAPAACLADASCLGYLAPSPNAGPVKTSWAAIGPNNAQLVATAPGSNAAWTDTTFFKKNA